MDKYERLQRHCALNKADFSVRRALGEMKADLREFMAQARSEGLIRSSGSLGTKWDGGTRDGADPCG